MWCFYTRSKTAKTVKNLKKLVVNAQEKKNQKTPYTKILLQMGVCVGKLSMHRAEPAHQRRYL